MINPSRIIILSSSVVSFSIFQLIVFIFQAVTLLFWISLTALAAAAVINLPSIKQQTDRVSN